MDLGNLPAYWRMIEHEFKAIDSLPSLEETRLLSARAFDQSQVAGPRTYMAASRYLNVARDNHEALRALIKSHGVTLWSPWSLLRPVFETSFFAAWILDPDDGRERRARGLRCEIVDAFEQRKHRDVFKALPEVREILKADKENFEQGSLATYKAEAASLGRSFDRLRIKVNVTDELPTLSFVKSQKHFRPFLEGTWRLLSGFEHGLGWALLSGTDRKVEAEIPGGATLHLTVNDSMFVNISKSAYFLLIAACRLFTRRHLQTN